MIALERTKGKSFEIFPLGKKLCKEGKRKSFLSLSTVNNRHTQLLISTFFIWKLSRAILDSDALSSRINNYVEWHESVLTGAIFDDSTNWTALLFLTMTKATGKKSTLTIQTMTTATSSPLSLSSLIKRKSDTQSIHRAHLLISIDAKYYSDNKDCVCIAYKNVFHNENLMNFHFKSMPIMYRPLKCTHIYSERNYHYYFSISIRLVGFYQMCECVYVCVHVDFICRLKLLMMH